MLKILLFKGLYPDEYTALVETIKRYRRIANPHDPVEEHRAWADITGIWRMLPLEVRCMVGFSDFYVYVTDEVLANGA